MTMTKPEIKAEWIRRLRSGKYEQGRGRLCHNSLHCCLGVLAEIAAEQEVVGKSTMIAVVDGDYDDCDEGDALTEFGGETSILPDEVREWAGLSSSDGEFFYEGAETSLVILNDEIEKTFAEIAGIIESHPEGLFTREEGETNDHDQA